MWALSELVWNICSAAQSALQISALATRPAKSAIAQWFKSKLRISSQNGFWVPQSGAPKSKASQCGGHSWKKCIWARRSCVASGIPKGRGRLSNKCKAKDRPTSGQHTSQTGAILFESLILLFIVLNKNLHKWRDCGFTCLSLLHLITYLYLQSAGPLMQRNPLSLHGRSLPNCTAHKTWQNASAKTLTRQSNPRSL